MDSNSSEPPHPLVSVIVPVLNDAAVLDELLQGFPRSNQAELMVVDGGSEDGTPLLAARYPEVRWVASDPGRAAQMNAGAALARGSIVLFLHADSRLPVSWEQQVRQAAATPGFSLGSFRFKIRGPRRAYRLLEWGVDLRTRCGGLPYGDQTLFTRKELFDRVGGYPEIPLMEDVRLVGALKRVGRMVVVDDFVSTSPRNWEADGLLSRTLTNWKTALRHRCGVSEVRLAASYARSQDALVLFCKEPLPGKVKTRLAETEGAERAADIYRALAERTLAQAGQPSPGISVYVFFDPAEARQRVMEWLGVRPRYVAQRCGDLGDRMRAAVEATLERGARKTVIVGTDCPALSKAHVQQALEALDHADVVLGPTADGGYYLLATREPHPALFENIPWSTENVLASTLDGLRRAGLTWRLLETLHDVDVAADLVHLES